MLDKKDEYMSNRGVLRWIVTLRVSLGFRYLSGVDESLRPGWRDSTVLFIFLYCILCNFMCEQVNMPRSKPAPDRLPSVAGPMLWTMTGFTSREQGFADQDFLAFSRIHVTVCHLPNKISSQQCKMDAQVLGNCTKAIWLADFSSLECARALLWYQRVYTVPYCISSPPTQIGQSSSSTRK